ncbi:MAG: PDZ domain-containing protein [Thermoguttaceae bacterium]|jgi:membrane-associated protease RseP (regulator of RpoE activity)
MNGSVHRCFAVALGCVLTLLAAGAALGQETGQSRPPEQGQMPPPTFLTPFGGMGGGAIYSSPGAAVGDVPQGAWQVADEQAAVEPSEYWIGLQCVSARPELRFHLGLADDEGILVEAIIDKSPAAKAGIQKYDVLTRAGDKKLTKVQDLIDAVDAVKEGLLKVELVRGKEKKTVEVTPEKRPPIEPPGPDAAFAPPGEWQKFYDFMKQWEPGKGGRPSMRLRFWHPGAIITGDEPVDGGTSKLPKNVTIKIQKEGEKPAEVTVTRGDQTWNVKEDDLAALPDDLRPYVERMLGKAGAIARLPLGAEAFAPFSPERDGRLEKRLEELNRRIDSLRQSIEELRKNRGDKPSGQK